MEKHRMNALIKGQDQMQTPDETDNEIKDDGGYTPVPNEDFAKIGLNHVAYIRNEHTSDIVLTEDILINDLVSESTLANNSAVPQTSKRTAKLSIETKTGTAKLGKLTKTVTQQEDSFGIYAADGSALGMAESFEQAQGLIISNNLIPVMLH